MDIKERKILFVQEFLNLENESNIRQLEDLLRQIKKKEYSQKFNQEIDQAMEDSDNDYGLDADDLENESKNWE